MDNTLVCDGCDVILNEDEETATVIMGSLEDNGYTGLINDASGTEYILCRDCRKKVYNLITRIQRSVK